MRWPAGEMSVLVFGLFEEDRLKWRGVTTEEKMHEAMGIAFKRTQEEPIWVEWTQKLAA